MMWTARTVRQFRSGSGITYKQQYIYIQTASKWNRKKLTNLEGGIEGECFRRRANQKERGCAWWCGCRVLVVAR
ncbi:hypothetical protein Hanom_Chr13g01206021 [Helianthus anomalus]